MFVVSWPEMRKPQPEPAPLTLVDQDTAHAEARVVRVTPFRFGEPEAGETAKILRRASGYQLTKVRPADSRLDALNNEGI